MTRRCLRALIALLALIEAACSSSESPPGAGNVGTNGGRGNTAVGGGGTLGSAGSGNGPLAGAGGVGGAPGVPATGGASAISGAAGSSAASAGAGGLGGSAVGGAAGASGAGGAGDATRSKGCGNAPTLVNSPGATINYNELTSAGLNRRYILRLPDDYDAEHAYRLVIAYHWGSGAASYVFDCNTEGVPCATTQSPFYGLLDLAENSTIFVAPDGIDAGWANTDDRDLTFTDDLLAELEADLCIDKTRIFANGFSYGAAMSSVVGCQRSNVFRAVALYAGGIDGISGPCPGNMPMAFYGGIGTGDDFERGQLAAEHFAEVNGCTAQAIPAPPNGGHACISYSGCSAERPVRFCPFDGGHTPSPRDSGQTMTWQPLEAWTFFSQF